MPHAEKVVLDGQRHCRPGPPAHPRGGHVSARSAEGPRVVWRPGAHTDDRVFTRSGIPPVLALLVIVTEFLGPLGLALGLLTRVVAFGLLCEMVVAMITVHWPNGFFMNWTGAQQGEGFEYHLLVIGIALTLLIVGAGAWSIDRALAGRTPRSQTQN